MASPVVGGVLSNRSNQAINQITIIRICRFCPNILKFHKSANYTHCITMQSPIFSYTQKAHPSTPRGRLIGNVPLLQHPLARLWSKCCMTSPACRHMHQLLDRRRWWRSLTEKSTLMKGHGRRSLGPGIQRGEKLVFLAGQGTENVATDHRAAAHCLRSTDAENRQRAAYFARLAVKSLDMHDAVTDSDDRRGEGATAQAKSPAARQRSHELRASCHA